MKTINTSLALALTIAPLSFANELAGTLDGKQHNWHILEHQQGSTANFSEIMPGMYSVSIQGHRQNKYETKGTLTIDFMIMQGKANTASVTYFPESTLTPHYGTKEEVSIQLDVLELNGDTGRASGSVETSLLYVENLQTEHNPNNKLQADIRFDVTLQKE
ncbi:hypothetical protein [Oceanimonas baumannii]|uniref:Uncharacterized protein n=2 Tax=Oceanimonas baumannii TaxID=129578 RepID=A0A235CHM6_9GAMM|nr:hypothetical protein [Oceanimonas baumannii]OYD23355.1 hypothetical protein B6S09_12915 [Oceanimonas baumannii]TDW58495.1 hypothetical protein LY04_02271 [Oceanimonas baumannii]